MKESAKIFLLILFICLLNIGSIHGQSKLSSADNLYYMSHFGKSVPGVLPVLRQLDIAADKFNKFLQKSDNFNKAPEVYKKLSDIYLQKREWDNALNTCNSKYFA